MQPNLLDLWPFALRFSFLAPMQHAHETWGAALTCTTRWHLSCTSCKLVALGAMIVKQHWRHWQLWRAVTVKHTWSSYVQHLLLLFHDLIAIYRCLCFNSCVFLDALFIVGVPGTFLPAFKFIFLVPQYLISENRPCTDEHCMIKICMYSKNISIKLVLSLKLSSLSFIWIELYLHSIYDNQGFPQMRNPMSLTTKYHPAINGQTDRGACKDIWQSIVRETSCERQKQKKGLINWSCMMRPTRFLSFRGYEFAVCFLNSTSTQLPFNYTKQLCLLVLSAILHINLCSGTH